MSLTPTLRQWLTEEPFTLAMSAGFFGFHAHAGALGTLLSAGFAPRRAVGASAGALVTGLHAGGVDQTRLVDEMCRLKREDFWDPVPGPGLLRGKLFRRRLESLVGDQRVESCHLPWAASAFDLVTGTTRALEHGRLATAIQASCAVPVLFWPVWHSGRPYVDGGVVDRPALAPLAPGERTLLHYLPSQSRWRSTGSAALLPPRRDNVVSVVVEGLPRVDPFHLDRGPAAIEMAERAWRRALDRRIRAGVIVVDGRLSMGSR